MCVGAKPAATAFAFSAAYWMANAAQTLCVIAAPCRPNTHNSCVRKIMIATAQTESIEDTAGASRLMMILGNVVCAYVVQRPATTQAKTMFTAKGIKEEKLSETIAGTLSGIRIVR